MNMEDSDRGNENRVATYKRKSKSGNLRISLLPVLYCLIYFAFYVLTFTIIYSINSSKFIAYFNYSPRELENAFFTNNKIFANWIFLIGVIISNTISFLTAKSIMINYKPREEDFESKKINSSKIVLIIISALALTTFIYLFFEPINFVTYFPKSLYVSTSLLTLGHNITIVLVICIYTSIVEEFIFRESIYNLLKEFLNTKRAIIIQALIFAVVHLFLFQNYYGFVLGIVLGILYANTKSIKAVIILRITYMIIIFVAESKEGRVNYNMVFILCSLAVIFLYINEKIKNSKEIKNNVDLRKL